MAISKVAVGHSSEATAPDALKAGFAEGIGTFLFVFVGLGSVSAYNKIYPPGDLTAAGLVGIALAHGLAIIWTVAATANISGGHINPAVTFGLVVGGQITVLRAIVYWIGQLLGAVLAAAVLKFIIVNGEPVPPHALGAGVTSLSGTVLEIVLTFALVFVVYATAVDPKKGSVGIVAPLAIGMTVLANHFIGVPYTGASMNPARSFGPAVVNWSWDNHWVYWVGPFVGAALAGLIYDGIFISNETPVPTDEY
ncbi:hypothetical protein R1sor_019717 [Riccia sorocarpa]|uniref:Uncharacterized protein n=1 Tax=Riccia sorocarpa TaxID=122646 RepID=A0ABD3IGY5_9MARC